MGLLDDLAMGFGLKERTRDYDARTARNIAISEAAGNWGSSRGYSTSPAAMRAEARIRDRGNYDVNREGSQARAFLTRQGGNDPSYNPQIVQDDRPFLQRALFSPQDQLSPTPVAIGPFQFDEPLRLPGILGMISGGFGGLFGPREVPTVSAPSGPTRVRPSGYQAPTGLTDDDMGLPGVPVPDIRLKRTAAAYTTPPYEIGNSGLGMNYVARSPRSILDDYQTLADPNMPAVVGLAPAAETPEAAISPAVEDEDVSFSEYMEHQRQIEATYGYPELSAEQYRRNYARQFNLTPITRGPHEGKFVDANGRLVVK